MEPATSMEDTIMEERSEDLTKPTKTHNPTRQISTFLKPCAPSSTHNLKPFPFTNSDNNLFFNKNLTFKRNMAFKNPLKGWKDWVYTMQSKHKSTWQKAGIYDAVLNSSYKILKNHDLVLSFVKKWCPETNTFVFVWGEVGITLEDILVIGGFSVLGRNVSDDVGSDVESEKVFGALREAITELGRSSYRNASQGGWIKMFKDSGSEFEHEAFLALWLSRFVIPSSDVVVKSLCRVAVCLARGVRIALAPAVLASIYKDLSLLKDKIGIDDKTPVIVRAPMQLVQIWIWERFPKISPKCKIGCNLRFARWENTNVCLDDAGSFVDHCAFEDFIWQPYVKDSNENSGYSKVYQEKGRWVVAGDYLDEELESWVRCVRVSELVGQDGSCIQQYLPHRVAMQFGMNQDVPADVARVNGTCEIAWKFYTRPVKDAKFYIPSRLSEPYFTARYLVWRNKETGECSLQSPICDKATEVIDKDGSRSDGGDDIPRLGELEARISRLEEEFAYLKAKKAEKC